MCERRTPNHASIEPSVGSDTKAVNRDSRLVVDLIAACKYASSVWDGCKRIVDALVPLGNISQLWRERASCVWCWGSIRAGFWCAVIVADNS
jgi:hypothetical protein